MVNVFISLKHYWLFAKNLGPWPNVNRYLELVIMKTPKAGYCILESGQVTLLHSVIYESFLIPLLWNIVTHEVS